MTVRLMRFVPGLGRCPRKVETDSSSPAGGGENEGFPDHRSPKFARDQQVRNAKSLRGLPGHEVCALDAPTCRKLSRVPVPRHRHFQSTRNCGERIGYGVQLGCKKCAQTEKSSLPGAQPFTCGHKDKGTGNMRRRVICEEEKKREEKRDRGPAFNFPRLPSAEPGSGTRRRRHGPRSPS